MQRDLDTLIFLEGGINLEVKEKMKGKLKKFKGGWLRILGVGNFTLGVHNFQDTPVFQYRYFPKPIEVNI